MIILVTGGRHYSDWSALDVALNKLHAAYPITGIVHGAADGADRLADDWALLNFIPRYPCAADWESYGPGAGPRRNGQMLLGPTGPYGAPRPQYCVAFPGGSGTGDMVRKASLHGLTVWEPYAAR